MKEKFTHNLDCVHAIGRSRRYYTMPCIFLKDMGDGRAKVRVFGDMYWKREDEVGHVRYIQKFRLTSRKKTRGDGVSRA